MLALKMDFRHPLPLIPKHYNWKNSKRYNKKKLVEKKLTYLPCYQYCKSDIILNEIPGTGNYIP